MTPSYILLSLLFVVGAVAHMTMFDPSPLRYKDNPYRVQDQDYTYSSPLGAGDAEFPCKGHHIYMGTPEGRSVMTYAAGGTYNIRLTGNSTHGGGSCQISLSHDKGGSFGVIKSYIGDCVRADPLSDQIFGFTIPYDTPIGDALLSWSWFNNVGNREMYMNCAVVTIKSGQSKKKSPKGSIQPRTILPSIFVANIGKGCATVPEKDVDFPSPGTDVTYGAGADPAPPEGDSCGVVDIVVGTGNETTTLDIGNTTSTSTSTSTSNTTDTDTTDTDTTNTDTTNTNTTNTDTTTSPTTLGTADAAINGNGATATPDATHDCAYWEERNYICALGIRLSTSLPSAWLLLGVMILWVFIP